MYAGWLAGEWWRGLAIDFIRILHGIPEIDVYHPLSLPAWLAGWQSIALHCFHFPLVVNETLAQLALTLSQ